MSDFHSIIGIFLRHTALKQYRYIGHCYRGLKLSIEEFEANYQKGQSLLIKPFMSASKDRHIAETFATTSQNDSGWLSVLFIYTIPKRTHEYEDHVALDISRISEYPHEEEILILPYTSLQIEDIKHLPNGLIEIHMNWYSFSGRY